MLERLIRSWCRLLLIVRSYYGYSSHAGGEGVHFRLLYAERILEHHPWQWWVGGKESHSNLGEPWILAVEGGDGQRGVLLVQVDLEVGEAAGEDEEIAGVERGLEERVVGGGGDEADGERALHQEEHLAGTRVDVGLVQSAVGREVDASDGQALRIEPREGGHRGQGDHGRLTAIAAALGASSIIRIICGCCCCCRCSQQRGREVLGYDFVGWLAGYAIDGDGCSCIGIGHTEILQRVLVRCAHK